jgi:tetratricopeptide (TPR) repeat protein
VRFACRSLWACGDWQNAKTEISLFADELLRFHDTEHHSSEQRVDELLFLLDYVRLQTLSEAVCDGITPKLAVCENILSEIKSASDVLPDEAVFIESQYLVVKSRLMDRMGDGQRSISLIRDFLSSQRHFDHLSRYQNARLQNEIGLCSWHVGDLSSALKAFEAAAALFAELKNDLWLAGALTNLGFVHTDRENFSKAVEVCEQAHRLHHKVGNKAWELINLGALGMAFIWSNRFDEGIERLSSALDGAVENDPESAAQFKGDIGRALLVRNEARDLEKALMYLEEAVEVQLQNGKSRRLFGNQVLLAEASRRAGVTGDRLKTLTQSARETAESLNLTLGTNVLQVRRDVRLLENIETSLVPGK